MGNRVEDLERQVSELQAAVEGVTEELVETKERLRQLEDEAVTDAEPDAGRRDAVEAGSDADGTEAQADAETETKTEAEAEADKADESIESDEESEDSDIIVA